jgi:hypothetical protein
VAAIGFQTSRPVSLPDKEAASFIEAIAATKGGLSEWEASIVVSE